MNLPTASPWTCRTEYALADPYPSPRLPTRRRPPRAPGVRARRARLAAGHPDRPGQANRPAVAGRARSSSRSPSCAIPPASRRRASSSCTASPRHEARFSSRPSPRRSSRSWRAGLMFAARRDRASSSSSPPRTSVQLRSWEGEDPRGIRALLAQAPFETMSAIAAHYLGRPATPPICALARDGAGRCWADPHKLAEEIEKLSATERRVLEAVEHEGGEVGHRRAPGARTRAAQTAHGNRGDAVASWRRLLARAARPPRPGAPEPARRADRGGRDHRRGTAGGARGAPRAGAELRPVGATTLRGARASRSTRSPWRWALALAAPRGGQRSRDPGSGRRSRWCRSSPRASAASRRTSALVIALSRAIGLWEPSAIMRRRPPGRSPCTSSFACSFSPGDAAARGTRRAASPRCSASRPTRATRARPACCARWSWRPCATSARGGGCRGRRSNST